MKEPDLECHFQLGTNSKDSTDLRRILSIYLTMRWAVSVNREFPFDASDTVWYSGRTGRICYQGLQVGTSSVGGRVGLDRLPNSLVKAPE